MSPIGIDHAISGDLPYPEMKGHDRILEVLLQASIDLDKDILHNITCIDSRLDTTVQSHLDQSPDGIPVSFNELVDSVAVTLANAIEQFISFLGLWPHLLIILQPVSAFQ
jgi:hypothetical protein